MMDITANTYYRFFRQFSPPSPLRLGVSVSGGVDSMVLLHLAHRFADYFGHRISVIHFNHGLRAQSVEEEASVVSYCESLCLSCQVHHFTKRDWDSAPGTGIEEKARELRRQIFQMLIQQGSVDWILLGHSLDDRTETALFHFIRGCSPSHLSHVMLSVDREHHLLRPLLTLPKSKLIEYAAHFHLPTHEDESNLDTFFSRNKIRHQLLPLIREINPNFRDALDRFIQILRWEDEVMSDEVSKAWEICLLSQDKSSLSFDKRTWCILPPAIQLRLLRKMKVVLTGNQRDFYYSQLISLQMGIMTNVCFRYEDKWMALECTEEQIQVRKRGENEPISESL